MKIIAFYCNKGGVGQTETSVNLAYVCVQTGRQVLLCDRDSGGASGVYSRAADEILVPAIPTTLFERLFGQPVSIFDKHNMHQISCGRSFQWRSIGPLPILTQVAARLASIPGAVR